MIAQAEALALDDVQSDPRFLEALQTKLEPVPLPFTYKAALGVVAFAMVLLPLLYVALVGAVAWSVVWYAWHGWGLLAGISSTKVRVFLYLIPLVAGGTVSFFLIKPLFARRQRSDDEITLDPAAEPLLFELVRRTALAVGAPIPREIRLDKQVNASASFRRGLWSLFSDDLVLTIGVPLAAGLTLEQLAGVLAHEFGHFGQRAGMRLSYVIRSVNFWFARVVYERDQFDHSLEQTVKNGGDWRLQGVAGIAAGCVWLSRAILKGLMYLGHMLSSSLLRQMEFDADRYAVRLVGREVHASVLRDVFVLSQAYQVTLSGVWDQYRQRTLSDSLAAVMHADRQRFSGPLDAAYREHLAEGRTHLFDTHPTDRERIAASLSGPATGVFACSLPASVLFRDFTSLERTVSRDLFQSILGRELSDGALVPAAQALAAMEESRADSEAAERYIPGGVSFLHATPLPATLPHPPEEPQAALHAAIAAVEAGREADAAAVGSYAELYSKKADADRAEALLDLGVPVEAASFGLEYAHQDAAREVRDALAPRLEELARQLAPMKMNVVRRMTTALSLLDPSDAAGRLQTSRLLDTAARLHGLLPRLIQIQETRVLMVMIANADSEGNLAGPILKLAQKGQGQIAELLQELEGAADPFSEEPVPLARIAAPDGLPPAEVAPVYHTLDAAGALLQLHERILGRLCRMAEGMEAGLIE